MGNKNEAFSLMSKKEYELNEKKSELEQAKEEYRETLINETVEYIQTVLKEEGEIDERGLKIFLGDLSLKTKQLYSR